MSILMCPLTVPEGVDVVTPAGTISQILLLHVEQQSEHVHKTHKDEVFLRVGDESRKLRFEERLQLEYDRGTRVYETQEIPDCTRMNVTKESTIEGPLPRAIARATEVIGAQLRSFRALNPDTGTFDVISMNPSTKRPSSRSNWPRGTGYGCDGARHRGDGR